MRHDLLSAITPRADALLEQLPDALEGRSRAVHLARVAARRLVEVLALAGDEGDRAAKLVRGVRQALGGGRELDVSIECLEEGVKGAAWPPALVKRVRKHLTTKREDQQRKAEKELDRIDASKLRRVIKSAGTRAEKITAADILTRLSKRRDKRARDFASAIQKAGALYDIHRLHEVRIAAKKLRYVLEAFAEITGRATAQRVKKLKALQDELGHLHDLQLLQMHVRETEAAFVHRRGRVASGLARIADDLDTECRRIHAGVLARMPRRRTTKRKSS